MVDDIIAIPGGGSLPMPTDREGIADRLTEKNDGRAMEVGAIVDIHGKVRPPAGAGYPADQMASVVMLKHPV